MNHSLESVMVTPGGNIAMGLGKNQAAKAEISSRRPKASLIIIHFN